MAATLIAWQDFRANDLRRRLTPSGLSIGTNLNTKCFLKSTARGSSDSRKRTIPQEYCKATKL
eukprot:4368828-Amphidinium_carterae.1